MKNPKNHFQLYWEARSLDLGDHELLGSQVLVGLGFNVTKRGHLILQGQINQVEHDKGKIKKHGIQENALYNEPR